MDRRNDESDSGLVSWDIASSGAWGLRKVDGTFLELFLNGIATLGTLGSDRSMAVALWTCRGGATLPAEANSERGQTTANAMEQLLVPTPRDAAVPNAQVARSGWWAATILPGAGWAV